MKVLNDLQAVLRFNKNYRDVNGTIQYFESNFEILEKIYFLFCAFSTAQLRRKMSKTEQMGLPPSLAERLVSLESLVSAPDIIVLSKETNISIVIVARVYFSVAQKLGFGG